MTMNNENISRELIYLCVGEEINRMDNSTVKFENFYGIRYYTVDESYQVIFGTDRIYCSCNERYCWHIFKIISINKKTS